MKLKDIQNFCFKKNFAGSTHIKCIPVNWVESFPLIYQDGFNFTDQVVLKTGYSWLTLPCVVDTINIRERESINNQGKRVDPNVVGFIASDTPMISEVMDSMSAYEYIVIVTYKTGGSKIFGTMESPARFTSAMKNNSRLSGDKGYDIQFVTSSPSKSFFIDTVSEPSEPGDNCLPGTILILNSKNGLIKTKTVNSGAQETATISDSIITVRNSLLTPLDGTPTSVLATQNAVFDAPDAAIKINGTILGSAPSGELFDIEVVDTSGTQIDVEFTGNKIEAPDANVTINDLFTGFEIKNLNVMSGENKILTIDSRWVRNPQWPNIPPDDNTGTKAYAVFAVFEHSNMNDINIRVNEGTVITWGDGTDVTSTDTSIIYHKTYDYAALSIDPLIYYDGRNYKPVLIQINSILTFDQHLLSMFNDSPAGIHTNRQHNLLEVVSFLQGSLGSSHNFSAVRRPYILEHVAIKDVGAGTLLERLSWALNLQKIELPANYFNSSSNIGSVLRYSGKGLKMGDVSINNNVVSDLIFANSGIVEMGDLTVESVVNQGYFQASRINSLKSLTSLTGTNFNTFFNLASNFTNIGLIDTPLAQTLRFMFRGTKVKKVVYTDCSNVNDTTSMFLDCIDLEHLIMPGLTVGVSVNGNAMTAAALNAFMSSVGTAAGAQTLDLRNNPGSATCDPTIATTKGFDVLTA